MKMRINGRLYEPASPVELSLRELIEMERVTTELGMTVNLGVIEEKQSELDEIHKRTPDKAERNRALGQHPWAQMLFAVNVYAARRKAGDAVTFDDCLDLSPTDVEFLLDAEDEDPDPTGRSPRLKVSAVAAKRPTDRAKPTPKKSRKASTAA